MTDKSYSWYEIRAIYAIDHGTGATIEQIFEGTAPTELDRAELKSLVADWSGRMEFDIEEIHVIASGERDHVEETVLSREGRIQLGGI